jgi:hypothetical protein
MMTYPGLDHDHFGGMTPIGKIIRDAWVFGLLPESERCTNWTHDRLDALYDKVTAAWEPYGHRVSRLPPELRDRHQRLYSEAIARATALGWSAELGDDD